MKRKNIWKATGLFFAGMGLFTLLSRAAYQYGTAVVETAVPAGGVVTHTVRLTGTAVENQQVAVTTVAGLRVGSVLVNEGQQVAQGETLFTLDMDHLAEVLADQRREMRKQALAIQDAQSQSAAQARQRQDQQLQAQENYDQAVDRASTALDRAARTLAQAEQALEDYRNGLSSSQQREQTLREALQQAQQTLDQAARELERLQQEQDQAVQAALEEAAAGETPLSQEELEALAQTVRDQYAPALESAQTAQEAARTAAEEAQAALDAFQRAPAPEQSEQDLQAAVEEARQAYEDALADLDSAETTYGQAVRTAELPGASSSDAQIGQLTYEQMALALEKLEALEAAGGAITAPVDGVIRACRVSTGEKTTDTTAVLLADLGQGCKFTGTVTQEQSAYIGVGDLVTLRASGTGRTYEDLAVTAVAQSAEGAAVTVQLPGTALSPGASAEVTATRRSQAYTCCVPLGALRLDERNQPYVLVLRQADTVLGAQTQAWKVAVTVLEQGDTTAALAPGALSAQDRVIVSSDRPVEPGSRVRAE